jgi:RimJ/RimL family protein N-acetyltransferase
MNEFPKIETNRLLLRKIVLSDITSLLKYVNNKAISNNILNIPYPYSEEDAIFRMNFVFQGFKNKERYVFAIILKEISELIGEIGIHIDKTNNKAEVGFWLAEPFWGKGITTEALTKILEFGFTELKLNKILATHYLDNFGSEKVLQKCGMIKEAELIDHYYHNGKYSSVAQYRLTLKEWETANPKL